MEFRWGDVRVAFPMDKGAAFGRALIRSVKGGLGGNYNLPNGDYRITINVTEMGSEGSVGGTVTAFRADFTVG